MTKIRSTDAEAISSAIHANRPFQTHGSLQGTTMRATFGRLPREYQTSASMADYVIYSYATPIAWRTEGQWEVPDVKYSVTTSKQQGTVRRALRYLAQWPKQTAGGRTVCACSASLWLSGSSLCRCG